MKKIPNTKITGPVSNGSIPTPDELLRSEEEEGREFFNKLMNLKMKDALKSDEERNSPDTFGAKRLFLKFFVNPHMGDDFSLIARDFLRHEWANIDKHDTVWYVSTAPNENYPEILFQNYILNLMMNAVDAGSDYARNLFLYLHKTYYGKEYRQLKRFSKLSLDELISLSTNDRNLISELKMARVLVISEMSGIDISVGCNFIYDYLNEQKDIFSEEAEWEYVDKVYDTYSELPEGVPEVFSDEGEMYDKYFDRMAFTMNVLRSQAYLEDMVMTCNRHDDGLEDTLRHTLAVMKNTFGDREYTKEELILYSNIYQCVSALGSVIEDIERRLDEVVYGDRVSDFYDENPPLFKPEDVMKGRNEIVKAAPAKDTAKNTGTGADSPKYKEETLLKEIDELHRKIHMQEADIKQLKADASGKGKLAEEIRRLKEQMEFEHKELTALRNHVYNMTEKEEVSDADKVSLNEMKGFLRTLRIIIVGGHNKWQAKMKQEFPNWTYIDATVTGTVQESIVNKADYVYFFTDTISHSTYFRYMNVVKERGIGFGYIHGVNIDNTIRGMYRELKG